MLEVNTGDLTGWASIVMRDLRDSGHFDNDQAVSINRGVLCVAEEAGEVVKAYRRWAGQARRDGTKEDFADELADCIWACFCTATLADIDMDEALARKLGDILSRGWKEQPATA